MEYEASGPPKYYRIMAADDDRSGTLTVGLELEMLFATLEPGIEDPEPDAGEVYRGILLDAGGSSDHYDEGFDKWLVEHLEDNMPGADIRAEAIDDGVLHGNRTWRVVHDGSVSYDSVDRYGRRYHGASLYDWVGREITSEVLSTADRWRLSQKIDTVCQALRKTKVHLNSTTSVHVHVGRGDETFSILTMKKFITLLWRKYF